MDERDTDAVDEGRGDRNVDRGSDAGRVQDDAIERQHERTERVETVLTEVREDLGNQKYPVSSEELSARYAEQPIDLPNETESLGSVFRRLDESFEDEQTAYEAVVTELAADEQFDDRADVQGEDPPSWDEERAETQHESREGPIDEEDYESSIKRSRDRARRAQAESTTEPEPDDEQ